MKKRERLSQETAKRCQNCGAKPWCCITIATGVHRCLNCWMRYWNAR